MKRFLINIAIVLTGIIGVHLGLAHFANGYSDGFYQRLSTPQQSSLIIGTSRAAQGIMPSVLNESLALKPPIFNFSFSLDNSPYGEVYLKAIESKLQSSTENSLYILAVDPWSISMADEDKIDTDQNSLLYGLKSTSANPNYKYLIKNYKKGWGKIVLKPIEAKILESIQNRNKDLKGSRTYLHEDGWLEVFTSIDPKYVEKNIKKKSKIYVEALNTHKFSEYRYSYLQKTIELLQAKGTVYLVRLPVHQSLIELEDQLMSDFDQKMKILADKFSLEYLNLISSSDKYTYTDGNHLYKNSAKIVTQEIADIIESYK